MSYDIGLFDNHKSMVQVERYTEGGCYQVDGSTNAKLNITYNYSWFFHEYLDNKTGLRWLYGKKAIDTIDRLQVAVNKLGTEQWKDYWAPTPGNAGHALNILLRWARQHPETIWQGD